MTTVLVVLLTALPVAACVYGGARVGGPRLARRLGVLVLASACGVVAGLAGLRLGWTRPFGLLTPVAASLFAAGTAACWLLWSARAERTRPASLRERWLGGGLGAVVGVPVAGVLWIVAALGTGVASDPAPTPPAAPEADGWTQALVRSANRGFVRHLPVLGPLGDEVEATVALLNASPEARRALVRGKGLERLARLDSYRALAADAAVRADLDAFRDGSLLALYRLQRHPLVVAFMEEEEVRALLPVLRPSVLARELGALGPDAVAGAPRHAPATTR